MGGNARERDLELTGIESRRNPTTRLKSNPRAQRDPRSLQPSLREQAFSCEQELDLLNQGWSGSLGALQDQEERLGSASRRGGREKGE